MDWRVFRCHFPIHADQEKGGPWLLGHTHAAAGACAAAFVMHAMHAEPALYPFGLAVGAVSALLPDIDEPNSTISRRVMIVGPAIGQAFKHRTATHSIVAVLGFALLLRGLWPTIPPPILAAAVAGALSHLLADALTPAGAMWFWPLSPVLVTFTGWLPGPLAGIFATGGFLETHIFRPLFVLGTAWFTMRGLGVQI